MLFYIVMYALTGKWCCSLCLQWCFCFAKVMLCVPFTRRRRTSRCKAHHTRSVHHVPQGTHRWKKHLANAKCFFLGRGTRTATPFARLHKFVLPNLRFGNSLIEPVLVLVLSKQKVAKRRPFRFGRGTRTRTLGKISEVLPVAEETSWLLFGFKEYCKRMWARRL